MTVSKSWWRIVVLASAVVLFGVGFVAYHEVTAWQQRVAAREEAERRQKLASEALKQCDALASHPHDNDRFAPGVTDDQLAPGAAIEACRTAINLNPDLPRLRFELGRSLWCGHRDNEAFAALLDAAKRSYAPAEKYIGDAYLEGRGLPVGEKQSASMAVAWYKRSADHGFSDGVTALKEVQNYIDKVNREAEKKAEEEKRQAFDPALFQNPHLMGAIYYGKLDPNSEDVLVNTYVATVSDTLGGHEMFFIDQSCAPLVNVETTANISNRVFKALGMPINVLNPTQSLFNDPGAYISGSIGLMLKMGTSDILQRMTIISNEGRNDAIALEKRYDCKSKVVQQIAYNLASTYGSPAANVKSLSDNVTSATSDHTQEQPQNNQGAQSPQASVGDRPLASGSPIADLNRPKDESATVAPDPAQAQPPIGQSMAQTLQLSAESNPLEDGKADRKTWESWFGGLSGDAHEGAFYWAQYRNDRSLKVAASCASGQGQSSTAYKDACELAQKFLSAVDKRRKAEPDYRTGFNTAP